MGGCISREEAQQQDVTSYRLSYRMKYNPTRNEFAMSDQHPDGEPC